MKPITKTKTNVSICKTQRNTAEKLQLLNALNKSAYYYYY